LTYFPKLLRRSASLPSEGAGADMLAVRETVDDGANGPRRGQRTGVRGAETKTEDGWAVKLARPAAYASQRRRQRACRVDYRSDMQTEARIPA
jgi:hypothetical protein